MGGGSTRLLTLISTPPPPHSPLLLLRRLHHCRFRHSPFSLSFSSSPSSFSSSSRHHRKNYALPSSLPQLHAQQAQFSSAADPYPEWSALLHSLSALGYFSDPDAKNGPFLDFPAEFTRQAEACLAFARAWPHLLGVVSRRDVELVVEKGRPALFEGGEESTRRMRLYLSGAIGNVSDTEKADTVDLMRFLLSYVGNRGPSESNGDCNKELESSVRNLLSELAKISSGVSELNLHGSAQSHFPDGYGQATRSFRQNIEMKRGDWICARCNFMNFARNAKCLECEEARPKRQLTGNEWECPQCDFYNYGRNTVCLRCDCKHPGNVSLNPVSSSYSNSADLESKLAENEEKAQRWFSKVSQLKSASNVSSTIKDEDFPEIMPLRKGVNRFVVSTRKTPLGRSLANAQHRGSDFQVKNENKTPEMKVSRSLDEILGHSSSASQSDSNSVADNSSSISGSPTRKLGTAGRNGSEYVQFVPLPADMFAKKPENPNTEESQMGVSNPGEDTRSISRSGDKSTHQNDIRDKEKEQEEKSERWYKRVAELHNVTDLASAISDEDFPEIMPMRKGQNRFVVSKKKDRTLTSPAYKRQMAMEQVKDSNFVPFVPFPPDYFAKKDKQQQPETADSVSKATDGASTSMTHQKLDDSIQCNSSSGASGKNYNKSGNADFSQQVTGSSSQASTASPKNGNSRWSGGFSEKENTKNTFGSMEKTINSRSLEKVTSNLTGKNSTQPLETVSTGNSWNGKSLEGSAVKEPDPLDMSEEAKAERWFRRVAQIKDISELSQIPDEDFPSIMPMRKGVNRFVVSKRKTPLERRLTSQQYRRNLPVVSSDPVKKETEE